MRAGLQTNRQACVRSCVFTVMHTHGQIYLQASLKEVLSLVSVLLLGSLGIGERCFESRNNSVNSNPFADGLLISREISKVSFELPEGFSVTAENGSSKVCFELLKTFRVTPKTLPPGCLSEIGQPVQTYGVLGLFLVLYAIQSYLVVQRGTSDAKQCRSQRAVAFCLFQYMDDLFLLHVG